MPVPASEIERLILESMPGARVDVVDTAGDQNHYAVHVVAEEFRGLNRVQQQRLVNKALSSILHGPGAPLHAMALQTSAPD
ncbi:MAG: BolA/IbaG family iron-sulfur metabolism protein [Pseudomonadota bacterium]